MIIRIDEITVDESIQLNERGLDQATVQRYVEAKAGNANFPPITCFSENGEIVLSDGFHRVAAYRFLGLADIEADVREGSRDDAMVHAATANVTNGKPMSQKEKREAGKRLLEMTDWSDREIARRLAVDHRTIGHWRNNLSGENSPDTTRTVTRSGVTYEMDIENIGKSIDNRHLATLHEPTHEEIKERDTHVLERQIEAQQKRDADFARFIQFARDNAELGLDEFGDPLPQGGPSQEVYVTMFSSETNEYYTPSEFLQAARDVMGTIDLDPATCEAAQGNVKAQFFFTADDDGLIQDWHGCVWLNPPYGKTGSQSNQEIWANKLIDEYEAGRVTQAVLLVKAAVGYKWFEELWDRWPVCFARERLSFVKEDGNSDGQSKQGTAFFYFGNDIDKFITEFTEFGRIILPEDQR